MAFVAQANHDICTSNAVWSTPHRVDCGVNDTKYTSQRWYLQVKCSLHCGWCNCLIIQITFAVCYSTVHMEFTIIFCTSQRWNLHSELKCGQRKSQLWYLQLKCSLQRLAAVWSTLQLAQNAAHYVQLTI